ncbi:hypothetical protein GE09DRAFT_1266685 [Coniochaeta sp. 2T2.1]|nr:hypothetical protein GE09DRAFT_1266685 [Coniochaeta sp. 2T2.1]
MSVKTVKSISQAIATVAGKHSMVTVAYVRETDAWRRTLLSDKAAAEFTAVVEREAKSGALGKDVTIVALMERPHESEKDSRTYWTVFAIKNNDLNQGKQGDQNSADYNFPFRRQTYQPHYNVDSKLLLEQANSTSSTPPPTTG